MGKLRHRVWQGHPSAWWPVFSSPVCLAPSYPLPLSASPGPMCMFLGVDRNDLAWQGHHDLASLLLCVFFLTSS